jgi:hypothetical protein
MAIAGCDPQRVATSCELVSVCRLNCNCVVDKKAEPRLKPSPVLSGTKRKPRKTRTTKRGLRPHPKDRQKDLRAKKSTYDKTGCKFSTLHFSAPDFFACVPLDPEMDNAHGWRGNTTDKVAKQTQLGNSVVIRGIATPSVGIILIWLRSKAALGVSWFFLSSLFGTAELGARRADSNCLYYGSNTDFTNAGSNPCFICVQSVAHRVLPFQLSAWTCVDNSCSCHTSNLDVQGPPC